MRELTSLYEEARRGTLSELSAAYEGAPPKGEITLIVGPGPKSEAKIGAENPKIDQLLTHALDHMPVVAAAALVAEATGAPTRVAYARALALKEKNGKAG